MRLDEFLGRLDKVKRSGGGWEAVCPCHTGGQKTPSLNVSEGRSGDRMVVYCQANCTTDDVLRAMGLEFSDLYYEEREVKRELVRTYDYVDAEGTLLSQALRYEPKGFGQRRPDGNGDWIYDMKGVERVPYRLPELIEALKGGRRILVAEGEKDVDAIWDAEGAATCNPMGAGKWPKGWGERYFNGAHVWVIQDLGTTAEAEHARAVYDDIAPHAASIELRQAKVGKDPHDHLVKHGFSLGDFVPVPGDRKGALTARAAVEWFREKMENPPDPEDEGVRTPWAATLGTLRPGRFHLLGGYPADGKTAISLQFLRTACESGKRVDFFSIEMTAEELVERVVAAYGVPYTQTQSGQIAESFKAPAHQALLDMQTWDFEIHDEPDLTIDKIEELIAERDSELVVIDHIHAFGHKDRTDIELLARSLKSVAKRQRVPLLCLAHLARANVKPGQSAFPRPNMSRLRESGMLEAWADVIWFVWRYRNELDLPTGQGELIVAKSRFTDTTMTQLNFSGRHQRWEGGYS